MKRQLAAVAIATVVAAICARAAQDPAEAFYSSIRNDDLARVQALVKAHGVNAPDSRGVSPLMYAAAYGTPKMMESLIAAGAGVNAANAFGETALMWGVYDFGKTKTLLAKGAKVDARSKIGRTALLIAASKTGNSETVKLLLQHGADATIADTQKTTAIHLAAASNDVASMKLLLAKHADPKALDAVGQSPLMFAAGNGNAEMIRLLLARGADVNAVSAAETTPPSKAGPMAVGNLTALQFASTAGSSEAVKVLLNAGAKVNMTDVRGMSPLMLSVATDHPDPQIVRLLLSSGADLLQKDKAGENTSDWAGKYAAPEILSVLHINPAKQAARVLPVSASALDTKSAAEHSLALLERTNGGFMEGGACSACHAQNLTAMSRASLRKSGVHTSTEAAEGTLKMTAGMWTFFGANLLQRMDAPGGAEMISYGLFDFAAHDAPASRVTDSMIRNLLDSQRPEGNWHLGGIMRAPMQDGDFSRSAMAIRSIRLYSPVGLKVQSENAVNSAAAWLLAAKPQTTEDRTMQLLGLIWAQKAESMSKTRLRELQSQQRADGGWAQTPNLETDAYATGQALFAMHESGVAQSNPAFKRGVNFLLATQQPDGSWHVKSRATPIQPYFQSGFPYDHDQWISSAGTAWASLALSYAITPEPAVTRASR